MTRIGSGSENFFFLFHRREVFKDHPRYDSVFPRVSNSWIESSFVSPFEGHPSTTNVSDIFWDFTGPTHHVPTPTTGRFSSCTLPVSVLSRTSSLKNLGPFPLQNFFPSTCVLFHSRSSLYRFFSYRTEFMEVRRQLKYGTARRKGWRV